MKRIQGQSTVEYILVLAVVVMFLVAFLGPRGIFKQRIEFTLNSSLNLMNSIVQNISF